MSTTYAGPLLRLHGGLDELAAIGPEFRTTGEKQELLVGLSRVIARAQAELSRVLAVADDVAEATGDRSTASWLATATRDAHGTIRRNAALAAALDQRWIRTGEAFATGEVNLAQVRVITSALDALPKDLGEDLRAKAEAHLVEKAAEFGPRELARLGTRLLEAIAPEIADEAEYQRLLEAERRANAATKLNLRKRGDGSTDLHARIPDHVAGRLRGYLNAFTAPRRRHIDHQDTVNTPFGPLAPAEPDEAADLPLARQRGIAFVALLEKILAKDLPRHGGKATTFSVTIDWETLRQDVEKAGIAVTSTGDQITAGQARRLACQAGILPFVMGGRSVVLDQGREKRLYDDHQRAALNLLYPECTTVACTMPAEFCEAHHKVPWAQGGNTDLADGTLLCPFHHHRAHDPGWITHHHPNGSTSFTRRQ